MQANDNNSKDKYSDQQKADQEPAAQKIATNSNPAANANIKQAPFDKSKETNDPAENVGTEITDGEDG